MTVLHPQLRKQLEKVVAEARREAEKGAREALTTLGVGDGEAPKHLSPVERKLRVALRAHGRQLGDVLDERNDTQEIAHLALEAAYEHWHRLLFARFLVENDLLIHPEHKVSLTTQDCEELGRELGLGGAEVAAQFCARLLPVVFRTDDPVLQIALPPETRARLVVLLQALPREVFLAEDSLGWVYQYWQAESKDNINAAGIKIGADELAPVTQLFTEDYMVEFLLHNTLGAWWYGKRCTARSASGGGEEECRKQIELPGVTWKYLRFVEIEDAGEKKWKPAAGTFDGWPKTARELKVLDPCMGSGHFLVFALPILVQFRVKEEGLSVSEACVAVLRDNLFGLELDPRCTQIAAFNLALAAWRLGSLQVLPKLNLACSGLGVNATKESWSKLVTGSDETAKNLRIAMGLFHELFSSGPVLGSLINPRRHETAKFLVDFNTLHSLLEKALRRESSDEAEHELALAAQGIAEAAKLLVESYTLVATNVPYLGRGKQSEALKEYCESQHAAAKSDLATCFVERCLQFCAKGGSTALVTPQNWLFLGSYKKLREKLLRESEWDVVGRLGARAFETISGEVVNVALIALSSRVVDETHEFLGIDASEGKAPPLKAAALAEGECRMVSQKGQEGNPDGRIALEDVTASHLLGEYAESVKGLTTGDSERFITAFWEFDERESGWEWFQTTVRGTCDVGGSSQLFYWEDGKGEMQKMPGARTYARGAWRSQGVLISQMRSLPVTRYFGCGYDNNCAVIKPRRIEYLLALWAFCSSSEFNSSVRAIDQKLFATNASFEKVPFDIVKWERAAAEKYPHGLPKPFSSDPTQWLFSGHPLNSDNPLHVATARLLGYQWPRQTGSSFPDCPALQPDDLAPFADQDGIVCLTPLHGEASAADRLRALLTQAYSTSPTPYSLNLERELLKKASAEVAALEDWFRDEFFSQHCALFHHRPFIWHIWDGRKDGFHALVNYHKLCELNGKGRRCLETLTYTYLGDWIERQRDAKRRDEPGAEDRLVSALELQGELKKILEGEAPYDIFVRWKPLSEQAIGWEPDINDGVRLNIRPFMSATLSRGKKGAGILREKPNITWQKKDRGSEPERLCEDFPWFWSFVEGTTDFAGGSKFDGNRWNSCHYSLKFKRQAREDAKSKKESGGGVAKATAEQEVSA